VAEDMNSALNAIKGLLGDNADEKIQSVMTSLAGSDNNETDSGAVSDSMQSSNIFNDDSMQYMLRMKSIIDEMSHTNDARSNLLLSLKPYMRDSRKHGIDNAIKLLSLSKVSGLFRK